MVAQTKKKIKKAPSGQRSDPFTTFLGGLSGAGIVGFATVLAFYFGIYREPWFAVLIGVAAAIGVGIGAGKAQDDFSVGMGVLIYIVVLFSTISVNTYFYLEEIYTSGFTYASFEHEFLLRVYGNDDVILANVAGLALVLLITTILRKK